MTWGHFNITYSPKWKVYEDAYYASNLRHFYGESIRKPLDKIQKIVDYDYSK